jgi:hypothetical protein
MSELTDKMRTCAAHLASAGIGASTQAIDDAVALLDEAAAVLEAVPPPPGEPWQPLPEPAVIPARPVSSAVWIDNVLPQATPRKPNACPNCDSRANKTVRKVSRVVMLQCPVCDHTWKY